jgi:predicted permease
VVPATVLGLAAAVIDIPDSYGSQAAMASAINCLVIAHQFGLDRALVAGVIAWSTGIVVLAGLVLSLL